MGLETRFNFEIGQKMTAILRKELYAFLREGHPLQQGLSVELEHAFCPVLFHILHVVTAFEASKQKEMTMSEMLSCAFVYRLCA